MSSLAYAQGGPIVTTTPTSMVIENPCIPSEMLFLQGQMVEAIYFRSNANSIHFTFRTIWKMRGETLDGTKKYVWNDENVNEFNAGGASESTQVINHVMVRQSEAPGEIDLGGFGDDFKVKTTMHFTVNANGVPSASVTKTEFGCM
ncbi:MAG TPA: hypothetical protein VJ691_15610 [Vicinamibacterales bacterium]|nr:hypothetical protein [Vicinamibacterales bacterium]